MGNILIFDDQDARLAKLERYLSEAGYAIFRPDHLENPESLSLSGIDLVVVNLHPDIERTWERYQWFKRQHPHCPVLVYARDDYQALRSIKHAIAAVLHKDEGALGSCGKQCHACLTG